jgi:hypothetical protein
LRIKAPARRGPPAPARLSSSSSVTYFWSHPKIVEGSTDKPRLPAVCSSSGSSSVSNNSSARPRDRFRPRCGDARSPTRVRPSLARDPSRRTSGGDWQRAKTAAGDREQPIS